MKRVQIVKDKVSELYLARNSERANWADWMYPHHVLVVADIAAGLAERFGAEVELSVVAALLHDIADSVMKREAEGHGKVSERMSRQILNDSGFSAEEISLVVDDAIVFHSCHDGVVPATLEGKVLATADSIAHLTTGFYLYALWAGGGEGLILAAVRDWALQKIERDWSAKLQFAEVKKEMEPFYQALKKVFERLYEAN